jgi:hypothetical protein
MSTTVDRPRSGDAEARAQARRAETAALHAADLACDAYRGTLEESLRDTVRPDRVVVVVEAGPGDALATAVADLASVSYAAARAAHLAVEAGSEDDARRTGRLAESAAAAAEQGATALAHRSATDAAAHTIRLAHAAAMVAHLAADALETYGTTAPSASLLNLTDHPAVPFPPSWKRRIEVLGDRTARLLPAAAGDELVDAAAGARAAAAHALRAYASTGRGTVVSRTVCRVVRLSALAACYAGAAALDLRESG